MIHNFISETEFDCEIEEEMKGFYGGDFGLFKEFLVMDKEHCRRWCLFEPRCKMASVTTNSDVSDTCRFYTEEEYRNISEVNSISWKKTCKSSKCILLAIVRI